MQETDHHCHHVCLHGLCELPRPSAAASLRSTEVFVAQGKGREPNVVCQKSHPVIGAAIVEPDWGRCALNSWPGSG